MAGNAIRFQAIGLDAILEALDDFEDEAEDAMEWAMDISAETMLEAIRQQMLRVTKERTGTLHSALRIGKRKKSRYGSQREIGFFAGEAPHAHLVEFGHGAGKEGDPGGPAPEHPFMRPGYASAKGETTTEAAEEIRRRLGL